MKLYAVVIASLVLTTSCGKKNMKGTEDGAPPVQEETGSDVIVEIGDEAISPEPTGEKVVDKAEEDNDEVDLDKEEDGPSKTCVSKTISFDELGPSKEPLFKPGMKIEDQYEGIKFKFGTNGRHFNHGILFDSTNPDQEASGDFDLYIDPAKTSDGKGFGNILILAENNMRDSEGIFTNPDDNAQGGYMKLYFDESVTFEGITMIDMDEKGSAIQLFADDQKTMILERPIAVGPNGGFEVINFANTDGPTKNTFKGRKMKIVLGASGAVDNIRYCVNESPSQAK